MARLDLTVFEWAAIEPVLPTDTRGVARVDDRRVLNGIFWRLRDGCALARSAGPLWPSHDVLEPLPALAQIDTATSSSASSTSSNISEPSRPATTRIPQTSWRPSNSHQPASGCELMSPLPSLERCAGSIADMSFSLPNTVSTVARQVTREIVLLRANSGSCLDAR